MSSPVQTSRSVCTKVFRVNGRRTSLALEDSLLQDLQDIARRDGTTPGKILSAIENANAVSGSPHNLSSAVRVYIAAYYRRIAEAAEAELIALKNDSRRILNTSSIHCARRVRNNRPIAVKRQVAR